MKIKYSVKKEGDDYLVSLLNGSYKITNGAFEDCLKMNISDNMELIIYEAALGLIFYNLFEKELGLTEFNTRIERELYDINDCDDKSMRIVMTKKLINNIREFFKLEYNSNELIRRL